MPKQVWMCRNGSGRRRMLRRRDQIGASLIFFALLLGLIATSLVLMHLDSDQLKNAREKKTIAALAEAKAALIAYALKQDLNQSCTADCRRPGDLPCPDMNNNGVADDGACTDQSRRLGRFPWKTLGTTDLRDGYGERLWYAVSNQYKNNTRLLPLNADSVGTITVRSADGTIGRDATLGEGVVAVILAAGPPLTRADGVQQSRSAANENVAAHYLDIVSGIEDNADFVDGGSNGFIMGPVIDASGREVTNDRLIVITREEMLHSMEYQVLGEVKRALTQSAFDGYPNPADVDDVSCLTGEDIAAADCQANPANDFGGIGRLPVNSGIDHWENTIMRGEKSGNWFQQNGWREFVFYALAPACSGFTVACEGVGRLTLRNAIAAPEDNKDIVLISAGRAFGVQVRGTMAQKTSLTNYLEDENVSVPDEIYVRPKNATSASNDKALSVP